MPASSPIPRDAVGLRGRDDSRPPEPHPASLGHPYHADFPVQPPHMLGPDRYDAESLVPPSFPPGRPAVCAGEERAHGLGEVAQGLLLHHLAPRLQPQMLSPYCGELPTLLQVARCYAAARTPPRLLLHGKVPHEPGMSAMFP